MRQTKVVAKFLAAALALGVCGIADAKNAGTKKSGVHGVILSVQEGQSQITVRVGSAKKGSIQTVRITIDANTTVQMQSSTKTKTNSTTATNNTAGSITSLHAGDRIIIMPDTDHPTSIIDMGGGKRAHARKVK